MGMITDKQWLEELIPDHWLGSNGEQKHLAAMVPEYRKNCYNKLLKIRATLLADELANEKWLEIIHDKRLEFEALELGDPEDEQSTT
jgi:hypothetical protein